ncbi:Alpha-1, 3-mannosyl-glycoprotein 4-beta-N-acetylglucosaminyltransferase B [Sarcoptes scabiei]|nr:Alpha-1, 3-mannosyl-glycoprotein 4-beta-N-acetylglucosaminyltransferase B [Sarcoptes scabiei]
MPRKNRGLMILIGLLIMTSVLPIFFNLMFTINSYRFDPEWYRSDSDWRIDNRSMEIFNNQSHLNRFIEELIGERRPHHDDGVRKNHLYEVRLASRFAELYERVKLAELETVRRRTEIEHLVDRMRKILSKISSQNSLESDLDRLGKNFSQNEIISLPTMFDLFPHSDWFSLNPKHRIVSNRSDVSQAKRKFIFGIPNVKRSIESYLIFTLKNLIENLSEEELNQSKFVVLIAETDEKFIEETIDKIVKNFPNEIDRGLLEIISPPSNYYPNFSDLKRTLDDSIERVRWRTKQNFDFAYLMMYCRLRGVYYVQLEDDIVARKNYLKSIDKSIASTFRKRPNWLILDFCALGFIGKLFRASDLSSFILFFITFHNDKPIDWLLDNFVQTKVCRFDKDLKDCKQRKQNVWIKHKPSLFQHIGTYSSLRGKIQKLQDKGFGKINLFRPHTDNPEAEVYSTMKHYRNYRLIDAYEGRKMFWAMDPKRNDSFGFKFSQPIRLESCLIRSGDAQHPSDILYNATLQAKSIVVNDNHHNLRKNLENELQISPVNSHNNDGFIDLGHFDSINGDIFERIPDELNPIAEIRIRIDDDSKNWIIINEIHFKHQNISN